MEEASYGDAVVSFINSIGYCQVLHVGPEPTEVSDCIRFV